MRCFRQLLLQPRHWHLSHTSLLISWISYLAIISNVAKGQMQQRSGCEFGAVPSGVRVNPDGPPELFCQMPVCALFPEASTTLQHHPSTSAMPSSKLSEFSTFGTTSSPTAAWMPSSSSTSRQPSKMSSQTPWQMSTASTKKKHHQQQQQMSSSSSGGNPTMRTNPPPMTMMMMGSSQGQQQSQEPQTSTMLTTQQQQQGGRNEAEQMMMATMEMDGINNQMITEGGEGGTTAAADGAAEMMMEEEIRRRRVRRSAMKQPQQQQGTTSAPSVHCSQTLSDVVCDLPNEWTGALNEMNNGTHISLFMQCCTVDGLSQWAAPLKRVVLSQGEQFAGGPVLHNGEMVAFDLVKEIRKNVTTDNQVLYVLFIHRALCLAPVPAVPTPFVASATAPSPYSSASDGPPSPRLSKFSRLYVGARFGPAAAAAGPVGGTLDTARQYLPYSLVRKAVAVQRQREQRLMAINRRRPQKVGQQRQNGMGEMDNDSAVIKPAGMSMINGQQKQPRQRPIYGQRRPYRPWLSQQKQLTEEEDYYEDDGEEGIPIWLLHRRRTPWTKLKRIGSGRRKSKAGSEGNNTIATAVDGQPNGNDKFNRFLSTAVHRYNGGQQQPKGQKNGQHSGKVEVETDEMAVHSTKPRLYANGAGQYAPEQQIPIREPNSDEEFQSIVEQEVGSEIAQEDSQTAAAIVTSEANEEAATAAETAQNYVTLIPQREQQQQLQQQSAVPVGPFVAPAAPQQQQPQQQALYPAAVNSPYLPAPPLLPIGERVSPPTAPRGGCGNGGTCPAQAASVVTYTGG